MVVFFRFLDPENLSVWCISRRLGQMGGETLELFIFCLLDPVEIWGKLTNLGILLRIYSSRASIDSFDI